MKRNYDQVLKSKKFLVVSTVSRCELYIMRWAKIQNNRVKKHRMQKIYCLTVLWHINCIACLSLTTVRQCWRKSVDLIKRRKILFIVSNWLSVEKCWQVRKKKNSFYFSSILLLKSRAKKKIVWIHSIFEERQIHKIKFEWIIWCGVFHRQLYRWLLWLLIGSVIRYWRT